MIRTILATCGVRVLCATVVLANVTLVSTPTSAQDNEKIVVHCTYQNGFEDWTIDLVAKTVAMTGASSGTSLHSDGVITRVTDDEVVWTLGSLNYNTSYTLNRYTLGLARQQGTGALQNKLPAEPAVPCQRQTKQF
jgi:hypothetical protein